LTRLTAYASEVKQEGNEEKVENVDDENQTWPGGCYCRGDGNVCIRRICRFGSPVELDGVG
jgi:hypothetical protein